MSATLKELKEQKRLAGSAVFVLVGPTRVLLVQPDEKLVPIDEAEEAVRVANLPVVEMFNRNGFHWSSLPKHLIGELYARVFAPLPRREGAS